jgi:hypothetical protein
MGKKCCDSSSKQKKCCSKYPKCECRDSCVPIYYPNNCIDKYPCNPCCPPPCAPYPPLCPPLYPPFPLQSIPYTTYGSVVNTTPFTPNNTYTLYIINPDTMIVPGAITFYLPAVSTLLSTKYTKTFIISNLSTTYDVLVSNNGSGDMINGSTSIYTIPSATSITFYASRIGTQGYWTAV